MYGGSGNGKTLKTYNSNEVEEAFEVFGVRYTLENVLSHSWLYNNPLIDMVEQTLDKIKREPESIQKFKEIKLEDKPSITGTTIPGILNYLNHKESAVESLLKVSETYIDMPLFPEYIPKLKARLNEVKKLRNHIMSMKTEMEKLFSTSESSESRKPCSR